MKAASGEIIAASQAYESKASVLSSLRRGRTRDPKPRTVHATAAGFDIDSLFHHQLSPPPSPPTPCRCGSCWPATGGTGSTPWPPPFINSRHRNARS
ncbi:hypothetical protein [Gordonia sp. C13]|uniref:hypothetical protein n=1 Tax=Gordonia sp. C13 TaxID=2935078 RepID=UPI0035A84B00